MITPLSPMHTHPMVGPAFRPSRRMSLGRASKITGHRMRVSIFTPYAIDRELGGLRL